MGKYACFIVIVLITASLDCFSDEINMKSKQSIFIGGVSIYIGDNKSGALNSLEKFNINNKNPDSDIYTIINKQSNDPIGVVQFNDNKVIHICKFWGHFNNFQAYDYGQALFSALKNMKNEWEGEVYVQTYDLRTPGLIIYTAKVIYGNKFIDISISENPKEKTKGAQVHECMSRK